MLWDTLDSSLPRKGWLNLSNEKLDKIDNDLIWDI